MNRLKNGPIVSHAEEAEEEVEEEELSISTVKGKDILVNQIGFAYQIFKDTDVYVIEVNKEEG